MPQPEQQQQQQQQHGFRSHPENDREFVSVQHVNKHFVLIHMCMQINLQFHHVFKLKHVFKTTATSRHIFCVFISQYVIQCCAKQSAGRRYQMTPAALSDSKNIKTNLWDRHTSSLKQIF